MVKKAMPPRPSQVPSEAVFEEQKNIWSLKTIRKKPREERVLYWTVDGVLYREFFATWEGEGDVKVTDIPMEGLPETAQYSERKNCWVCVVSSDQEKTIFHFWSHPTKEHFMTSILFFDKNGNLTQEGRVDQYLPPDNLAEKSIYNPLKNEWIEPEINLQLDSADQFLTNLRDWDQFYPQWSGCKVIDVSNNEITSRGKNKIYPESGDWLVYDKRCFEGTYGVSHDDFSIKKTKIKNPQCKGVNYEVKKIRRVVSTLALIKRYQWIGFMFIGWQHREFTSPYEYDWGGKSSKEDTKKLNKAFRKELSTFSEDPHLALYWLIHFGLSYDERYDLVKNKVLEFDLGKKLEDINACLAFFDKYDIFSNIDISDSHTKINRKNLFLIRRANLIWMTHSYVFRGGDDAFEKWWLSICLAPEPDEYTVCRIYWFYKNIDQYRKWEGFEAKLTHQKINLKNPEISLLSYVLAMNPNEENKNYYADLFLDELNQCHDTWKSETVRSCVQIMLWELRGIFLNNKLLKKVMNFYFKKIFHCSEYGDLNKSHFISETFY